MNLFRIFQLCFFLPVSVLVLKAASLNASSVTNIESYLKGIRDDSENDIESLKAVIVKLSADVAGYALHDASKNVCLKTVNLLLENRSDIDKRYAGSVLRDASKNGHIDIVKTLLEKRLDIEQHLVDSAVWEAVKNKDKHFEIAELLLNKRRDVMEHIAREALTEAMKYKRCKFAENILKLRTDIKSFNNAIIILREAYKNDCLGVIEYLLSTRNDLDNYLIYQKLFLASELKNGHILIDISLFSDYIKGRFEIIKLLIQYKGDFVSVEFLSQCEAEASRHDNSELLTQILLLQMQKIDSASSDRVGQILLEACTSGNSSIVEKVLERRSESINSDFCSRSVLEALKHRHFKMAELTLQHTINYISADSAGQIFTEACKSDNFRIVETLLLTNIDFSISYIEAGLLEASDNNNLEIVNAIIDSRFKIKNHESSGRAFVCASKCGRLDIIQKVLSLTDNQVSSKLACEGLWRASENGHSDVVSFILERYKDKDDFDIPLACQEVVDALKNGHLRIVRLLLELRDDVIDARAARQILLKASKNGYSDMVRFLLKADTDTSSISNSSSTSTSNGIFEVTDSKYDYSDIVKILHERGSVKIDSTVAGQGLLSAFEHGHTEIVKCFLETRIDISVPLKRQGLGKALEKGHHDIVKTLIGNHRVGLRNINENNGRCCRCCRFISFISCLYHIPRFRKVLYSSALKKENNVNVPSLKLAELFVQMQLGNSNLHMEDRFVQFYKQFYPNYNDFWWNILRLRNNILDLLPEETKNTFQVSLRLYRSQTQSSFKDVTRNFITISRNYKSISEAIASKFSFDVKDNLSSTAEVSRDSDSIGLGKRNQIDCERDTFNQIEILNRPEILMFGIKRSDVITPPKMELDFEITLPPPPSNNSNSNEMEHVKYILQAFSYSSEGFSHHMSFIRDLSSYRSVCEWYKHDDSRIKPTFEEDHLESMKKYANSYATFAFYVRSDLVNTPNPDIPENYVVSPRHLINRIGINILINE